MDAQYLTNLLRDKGLKVTTQRLAIFNFILSRKDHPTAEQIYHEMRFEYPTISLGTIYKNLHLLKELGLIQELGFNEGSVRYDPDMDVHINMICTKCGAITDYKSVAVEKLWNSMISDLGIKSKGQRIDIYHECEECK